MTKQNFIDSLSEQITSDLMEIDAVVSGDYKEFEEARQTVLETIKARIKDRMTDYTICVTAAILD
jgi:hypothetical protein